MRSIAPGLTLLLVAAVAGCKPPPREQVEPLFRGEVKLYFNNLNQDGHARKESLRTQQDAALANPTLPNPTGTMYSTYLYDDSSFIVQGYKCRTCSTKLILTVPALEYLCPSCGHSPYKDHGVNPDLRKSPCSLCVKADTNKPVPPEEAVVAEDSPLWKAEGVQLKKMFEITQPDTAKPLVAKVRYVRRSWVFDQRGTVTLSPVDAARQKALTNATSDIKWFPKDNGEPPKFDMKTGKWIYPIDMQGFHRLDGTFVGEIEFEFSGGKIRQMAPAHEEAVRPWKDNKIAK